VRTVGLAAAAALIAVLGTGCQDHHRPAATHKPSRLDVVLTSARTSAGRTDVTYRPARVQHVVADVEYNKITITGPAATLALAPGARVLLCTPLNDKDDGNLVTPEPVTAAAFVASLTKNRDLLPEIGFEMSVGTDGRIAELKEIYQP
jgi:hypothetical protein